MNLTSNTAATERLQACIKTHLDDAELCRSGAILYSTRTSFRQAPLLVMGTNPGGLEKGAGYAIANNIFAETHNLIIGWKADGGFTPLQNRLREFLKKLNIPDIESVPYTNLIFMRTQDTTSLDWDLAKECWPINKLILDIVQPHLVITIGNGLGNSPYTFLKQELECSNEQETPSGFGHYQLRYSVMSNGNKKFGMLGLPHLSRYPIASYPEDQDWAISRAKESGLFL